MDVLIAKAGQGAKERSASTTKETTAAAASSSSLGRETGAALVEGMRNQTQVLERAAQSQSSRQTPAREDGHSQRWTASA